MIFQIAKYNKINDFQLQQRYKKYVDVTLIPEYAFEGIKSWVKDDEKFEQLKQILTLEIDRSANNITIERTSDSTFKIKGKNTHSLLFGFGYYVREIAHGHVGWCVERVPTSWTIPHETITVTPNKEYRLAYNFCTLSYTMAFWDEKQWEEEIIRLAMLGFNMALIISGLPKLWKLVLTELGQTEGLIEKFIPDEAAWAWWSMGNLQQNDGTVLSNNRIDKDQNLARFIVKKMRAVGIEPVFPCFTGLLPNGIQLDKQLFPDQNLVSQGTWCGYTCPILLDQNTKTYEYIAKLWYKHLKTVYDTQVVNYFSGDIFHESGNAGNINIANAAKSIQKQQQLAFKGAKWLLQCWQASNSQRKVFSSVDPKLTILQVLNCNMNASWNNLDNSGYSNGNQDLPVLFCEVLNFGGNTGIYGGYKLITEASYNKLTSKINANKLSGFGMLSEGLETNQIFYDAYTRLFYSDLNNNSTDSLSNEVNLRNYVNNYTYSRYGLSSDQLTNSTIELLSTLQNINKSGLQQGTNECLYCAKPGTNIQYVYLYSTASTSKGLYYSPSSTINVLSGMHEVAKENPALYEVETFRYDICDVARQVIADSSYTTIFGKSSYSDTDKETILSNINLMNELLATVKEWRLDYFESRVSAKAGTEGIKGFRRMITSWGKPGTAADNSLHDYAHRQYAGLMNYYYDRWNSYFNNETNFTEITKNFISGQTYLPELSEVSSQLSTKINDILTIFSKDK